MPLTTTSSTQNFYHLANSLNDTLVHDLMTGVYFSGQTYEISNLDLAILKDVGAPVTDLDGVDFRPAGQSGDQPAGLGRVPRRDRQQRGAVTGQCALQPRQQVLQPVTGRDLENFQQSRHPTQPGTASFAR